MATHLDDPHVVYLVCHSARYLGAVFAALARQTRRPDRVVVSCDCDDSALGDIAREWVDAVGCPFSWVRRAHHGIARCSQVRNNAVRHITSELGMRRGRIIQLDGDMLASATLVEAHARLGTRADLVYAHRVNVGEAESAAFDARLVAAGQQTPRFDSAAQAELARRHRRAVRHWWQRRFGLAPLHKPKLLGCNWSASLEVWQRVNGFDELYQGWGFLDDDFARRAAQAGATCIVGIRDAVGFHLHHPTRQGSEPMSANPNYQRFSRRDLPIRAEHGLETPLPQHPVAVTVLEPAGKRQNGPQGSMPENQIANPGLRC